MEYKGKEYDDKVVIDYLLQLAKIEINAGNDEIKSLLNGSKFVLKSNKKENCFRLSWLADGDGLNYYNGKLQFYFDVDEKRVFRFLMNRKLKKINGI